MNLVHPIGYLSFGKWKRMLYLILAVGLIVAIIQQLGDLKRSATAIIIMISTWTWIHVCGFLLVCIFSVLNWILEARKWQLLNPILTLYNSLQVVLGGLSWALITPLALGDYVGRYQAHGFDDWKMTGSQTLIASIAQNIWNIAGGFVLVMAFPITVTGMLSHWQCVMLTLFLGVACICFFWIEKVPIASIRKVFKAQATDPQLKLKLLVTSGFRYVIYVGQYIGLLWLFGSELSWMTWIGGVAAIYVIQSGLPIPRMLGLIVRVELGILIFSYEGESELIVLVSALTLWMINRLIPAIWGYFALIALEKKKLR